MRTAVSYPGQTCEAIAENQIRNSHLTEIYKTHLDGVLLDDACVSRVEKIPLHLHIANRFEGPATGNIKEKPFLVRNQLLFDSLPDEQVVDVDRLRIERRRRYDPSPGTASVRGT